MSKFRVGDKVVLINVDHYSDIMKQLMGKALVVNSIDTDKCGCEIVCARVPGEEGWFLYSDDLRLVSETQAEPAPEPAPEAQMPERSKLRAVNWGGCGMNYTDRELLELAAKAAGLPYVKPLPEYDGNLGLEVGSDNPMRCRTWNPLTDDGDALRLAVKLKMSIDVEERTQHAWSHIVWVAPCFEPLIDDPYAATRRAIVRAAAAIGEAQCHM